MNDEQLESLWVRIKGKFNMADAVVGVKYRPPNQKEEVDEVFCKHLEVGSLSTALVLLGSFSHPGICWIRNLARHAVISAMR